MTRKIKTTTTAQTGEIATSFKQYVYIDNSSDYSTGTVTTKDISAPGNDKQKAGLPIKFSDVKSDAKTYFVQDGDTYYLPYRKLSNCRYTNPSFEGKYIDCTYTVSSTKSINIRLKFEYTWPSYVINDEQLGSFVGWLNSNGSNAKTAFETAKSNAQNAAGNYSTAKAASDSAAKGLTGIDTQIATFTTSTATLKTQQSSDQTSYNDLSKKITDAAAALTALQNQQQTVLAAMNARASDISSTEKQIETLNAQKTAGTADVAGSKATFDAAAAAWTTAYTALKTAAKGQETTVDSANTELTTNNNVTNAKAKIASVS